MQTRLALHVIPEPEFIQRTKNEAHAIERAGLEQILETIPQDALGRLRNQLTPLLSRSPIFPDDRNTITRLMQEWQMRGLPVMAFNAMYDLVYDDHRADRAAGAAGRQRQLRRRYPEMYAPLNPGLYILRPQSTKEAGERVAALIDEAMPRSCGRLPGELTRTITERFSAFLRGIAPRQ